MKTFFPNLIDLIFTFIEILISRSQVRLVMVYSRTDTLHENRLCHVVSVLETSIYEKLFKTY